MATDTQASLREVWDWLSHVPDPEIPVISLTDLGIIRDVAWDDDTLVVTVTPTYTGCPAATAINFDIEKALRAKGIAKLELKRQISPAWTTDWISAEGREKLRAYGIAPPIDGSASDGRTRARVNRMMGVDFTVRLPALLLDPHNEGQPVWLDSLQGQLPLRRLPRALRLFQVHLSGYRRQTWHASIPSMSSTSAARPATLLS